MKEEEKQRKFHNALLQMLYPPPPSPPPRQEEDQEEERDSIHTLNCPPVEEVENEEDHDHSWSGDENGGVEKLTRAQRKRRRQKQLKEGGSRRRKIIGPLLPGSGDDCGNDGEIKVTGNVAQDVPQGEICSSSKPKRNKVKQRRKTKKLGGEKIGTSSIHDCTSDPSSPKQTMATQDKERNLSGREWAV